MAMIKIKDGYVMRRIIDDWLIVPVGKSTENGTSVMSVNESGHMLWELLIGGADEKTLLDKMLEEYDIDAETAARDIKKFVGSLLEKDVAEIIT